MKARGFGRPGLPLRAICRVFAVGGDDYGVFGIGVDPAIKVYAAEQYPTAIRGMGVGLAEGGALAPYIMASPWGHGDALSSRRCLGLWQPHCGA